jgi:cbb3-type cytochrome oxidase subunit 3
MIFKKTYRYQSNMSKDEIKSRLLGKHVQIHKLDFEIMEDEDEILIVPHTEQVEAVKTLPMTRVELQTNNDKTNIKIKCKMRDIDSGGPYLLITFTFFMFLGGVVIYIYGGMGKGEYASLSYTMLGISVSIFTIFLIRMQSGYFDYVKKVRDYVKNISVS